MKEIHLTKGKVAIVDDEDYERLMAIGKWYPLKMRSTYYAYRKIDGRTTYMHSLVLQKNDRKNKIDHKDGNGLNNQSENLRECTNAENLRHQKIRKNNTSGFKGVSPFRSKWMAKIRIGNKHQKYIGTFDTAIKAAKAYNEAAIKYHGEFANLNPI